MSESQTPEGQPIELPLDADAGPAHYITRAKADAIILRALDEAGFGAADVPLAAAAPSAAQGAASMRPRRRWSAGWLVAAAAILCATVGSASAAVLWYARVRGPEPVATTPTPRGERVRVSRRAPAPPSEAIEPTVSPIMPVESPSPSPAPKPAKRAPEDWLIEGNRLRAEKRWSSADEAYSRAVHGAPHSHSAYVAQVASAAVRLEHLHDARGALSRYRAALKQHPTGPLGEEIHYGIADAYRTLGDRAAEREALQLFLREHPGSALAAQARARLDR